MRLNFHPHSISQLCGHGVQWRAIGRFALPSGAGYRATLFGLAGQIGAG